MISGNIDRRRRALFWSTIASAATHLIVLTLLSYAVARLFVARGEKEVVAQTTIVTIKKTVVPTPPPRRKATPVRQRESAPAVVPRRELARETPVPAPAQPPLPRPPVPSKLQRDEAGFAREVAQLNAQDDPHAVPTIDPASRESSTKTYAFDVPSSLRGDEHGNGIITPVRAWRDHGQDCYYGRYEYTYPDGATESGSILWPFCYDPGVDPFRQPPHTIPFPLPLIGFRLPADAQMPPIEKAVYEAWAADNAAGSPPQ
ncbi:MAG TPA: hypothetical protein VFF63_02610 [Candidatus Babeliales bacterium]|nr:hypothetical protein [Candidatus Babeliales bacterium]